MRSWKRRRKGKDRGLRRRNKRKFERWGRWEKGQGKEDENGGVDGKKDKERRKKTY
jgi:hypothetical protein